MQSSDEKSFFERPKTIRAFIVALVVMAVVLVAADFLYEKHALYAAESIAGFYALAGFGSYAVLIVVAKALRKLIKRDEAYYD